MGKQFAPILTVFLYLNQFFLTPRPICPQDKLAKSMEETLFGISQQEIPQQDLKQDEFDCLNLNITCPAGLTPLSRLPVMLWIHGLVVCRTICSTCSYFNSHLSGGDIGSGSGWFYDGGKLVHRSMIIGKPVIIVTCK